MLRTLHHTTMLDFVVIVVHLRKILHKCKSLAISLNQKNFVLGVFKGKLLGPIVSKEGVKIDPERVKSIQEIP